MYDVLNDMEAYADEKIHEVLRKLYGDYDPMDAEMIKYYLIEHMIKKLECLILDGEISY